MVSHYRHRLFCLGTGTHDMECGMYSIPILIIRAKLVLLIKVRSESDEMFFRHATREGVLTFEETRVQSIEFEGDPASSRPVKALWKNKSGQSGEIEFDWLIDASGKTSIMANKYLKNRVFREGLRNIATWGYWTDVKINGKGTKRENAPLFEAMTGAFSVIPLFFRR